MDELKHSNTHTTLTHAPLSVFFISDSLHAHTYLQYAHTPIHCVWPVTGPDGIRGVPDNLQSVCVCLRMYVSVRACVERGGLVGKYSSYTQACMRAHIHTHQHTHRDLAVPLQCQRCQKLRIKQKPGWTIEQPHSSIPPQLWSRWFNPLISPVWGFSVSLASQLASYLYIKQLQKRERLPKTSENLKICVWASSLQSPSEVNDLGVRRAEEEMEEKQEALDDDGGGNRMFSI